MTGTCLINAVKPFKYALNILFGDPNTRVGNIDTDKIIDALMINIRENKLTSVYRLTGPGVFNQVLSKIDVNGVSYRYTCNQGNFTNEYFQYLDKAQGKWTKAQAVIDIVKK